MLDTTFHITTPRLHLSYLDPDNDDHMSFVVRMFASAEMQALFTQSGMSPPVLKSITEARTIFAHGTDRLATTGIGRYIISLRNPPVPFTEEKEREYVGTLSMQLNRYPTLSCPKIPDIGFMLLPEYFGKGYATEGCEALMQHFREAKNHSRFAGFTHPENVNSQKLFMRLGFEKRGIVDVAGIVGDGSASRSAVWVKGVSRETELITPLNTPLPPRSLARTPASHQYQAQFQPSRHLRQCPLLALATQPAHARPPLPARRALARLHVHARHAAAPRLRLTRLAAPADLDLTTLLRPQRRRTAVEARAVAVTLARA
ncbi:acyl-CoA N-acyltransferase [Cladochytrium replicatum]|nr:acyl-CoA N-acyltransferase [Cladochytrium replicatum]